MTCLHAMDHPPISRAPDLALRLAARPKKPASANP